MTPRQHEAIAAIRDLTVDGVGPTYDQLAERLGCASRGHAFGLVARLERAGLVTRQPNQRRSLRIVEDAVSPAVLAALSDAELRNTIAHSAGLLASRSGDYAAAKVLRNVATALLRSPAGRALA